MEGMLAQDREDFETACFHFSLLLRPAFPEYDGDRIFRASEAYTNALFGMCAILDIPKSFAIETVEWFRYHAIRDDAYVKHLLEAHRVYLKRVVGNDRWYRELSGIYLTAVGLHDKHDKKVVRLGKDLMGLYYGIMFREKYGSNGN